MLKANIETFLACDASYEKAGIVLYGAPFDSTTSYRPGTRFGSRAIRSESYGLESYSPYQDRDLTDYAVFDAGDQELCFGDASLALKDLRERAAEIAGDGKIPFMLGGEHLVTLAPVQALAEKYPDLHIIHFDAHADLRDDYLGAKLSHACVLRRCWEVLGDGRITQFGIRSGDREEWRWGKEHVTTHPFIVDMEVLQETLRKLEGKPVYEKVGINWKDVKHIFVTHKHIDHLLGMIWMIRLICQNMAAGKYEGEAYIYGHEEVIEMLETICKMLLQSKQTKYINDRLHLVVVNDGQTKEIIGKKVTFFDIHSTKAKQFGYMMELDENRKLTCCGDETYNEANEKYALKSDYLLHEAFCLYNQADIFHPYEKHHSTVKDACQLAEKLKVKNVVLYHSEDQNIENRKELYTKEGKAYFSGKIYVPNDLETIEL